ncbi:MAG TPA: hypothetical protein VE055_01530, partial [Gaiellaceae bacterium]|nr:hypothetical protein [Gaiellaceae bacterium]
LLQGAAGVAAGLLGLPGAPPTDAPPSAGVDPSFAILHGLYWLCANLAAVGPVCLVVDDAHWADTASLRYLAFLLTRLEELDAALVVAIRPRDAGIDAELLTTATTDPSADVIRLAPLTRAAVVQLLEAGLGGAPDPVVVDTCLRVTRGTPFVVRELAMALSERDIGSDVDSVGRSVRLRLRRLPEAAGRLAQALAVLEQSDLLQAARLAGLEELEAADAADLLATAGILEHGRPLTFVHPLVRNGIYSELPSAESARDHRRAAELLAEQASATARVAQHLLVSEPAADVWVVERLVEAARAAREQGASESEAVFLRRVLAEPPPPGERSGLLLDLGMAEASAGLPGWPEHLQQAVDAAPSSAAAAQAAMVLAHALSRAQRYTEAVEVLDRASSALDSRHVELALQLEAAAVLPALNDPVTVPSLALRREKLRERAANDPAAPPEVLASAAFVSILTNEPAETGADLATRAFLAQDSAGPVSNSEPWFSFAAWFAQTTFALLLAERYAQLRPLLDASIAQARVTGDGGRLAVGLRDRGWLALRRGDLSAAEGDARTALSATELPAPPMYRVMNGSLVIKVLVDQGKLDDAEHALAPLDPEAGSGFATAWGLRFARGRLRVAQGRVAEGLEDFLGLGEDLTRAIVSCPGYLPWRSEAALAQLALGVALRAVGVVAGGDRGASLLREAIDTFERGDATLERARALADL